MMNVATRMINKGMTGLIFEGAGIAFKGFLSGSLFIKCHNHLRTNISIFTFSY
jgi:hypothetical protein